MKVTDKKYYMEEKLKQKLDLCCDRCTGKNKLDNLIIIDGDEGYGKTNFGVGCAYYVAWKTKRKFNLKTLFFNIDRLIDYAIKTEDQVLFWDEAALSGLASEWTNKLQRKLIKLLMIARKKRHFYFFLIPKFFKLNEYLIVDRSIALIHVYARYETQLGRFVYFKKKSKERLYYDWKTSKKRLYKKHYDFHGSFHEVLGLILDEKKYDQLKDKAILSLNDEEISPRALKKSIVMRSMVNVKKHKLPLKNKEISLLFDTTERTLRRYARELKDRTKDKGHII